MNSRELMASASISGLFIELGFATESSNAVTRSSLGISENVRGLQGLILRELQF